MSEQSWTEDELAYNGQSHPMRRELTPRERDILCRLLRDLPSGRATVYTQELELFSGMRYALDPRDDDEIMIADLIEHDTEAGL